MFGSLYPSVSLVTNENAVEATSSVFPKNGSLPLWFIWDCDHLDSRVFGIVSIWDCVHSRSSPFEIMSIRECVHSELCPFNIVSVWGCVHSGLSLLGILRISSFFFDCYFQEENKHNNLFRFVNIVLDINTDKSGHFTAACCACLNLFLHVSIVVDMIFSIYTIILFIYRLFLCKIAIIKKFCFAYACIMLLRFMPLIRINETKLLNFFCVSVLLFLMKNTEHTRTYTVLFRTSFKV